MNVRSLLLAAFTALFASAPALAITDGELDGNAHPYVGLMVAFDAQGTPLWRCTGTLIRPGLFLTAGHCTEAPAVHVEIWVQSDVQHGRPANGYPFVGQAHGTPHTHPNYDPNAFFLHDVGVVTLDGNWVYGLGWAGLPLRDSLDTMDRRRGRQDVTFTAVGYGLQEVNPVHVESQLIRMVARPKLNQINNGYVGNFSLLLSNNHSTGGTCFGDSGGPNFIGTSNTIGGVTSFGKNGNCAGTGGVFRVDREEVLHWLFTDFWFYFCEEASCFL